jgi:hypothetical protein
MPLYSYEDGEYVMFYRDNGDVICRMEEVAICFSKDDEDMWTIHKHGTPERVKKYHDEAVQRFRNAGYPDMANDMVMIVGKFPVDELNHAVETSGYIKRMIEKLGLNLETEPEEDLDPRGFPGDD